jgi:hypothetical protein
MQRDAGEFHSRFGGFWIDRHDAGALLAERVADGRIHGGSRIRRRRATRQSLVTHFTPEHDDPPYAREVERVPVEQDGCLFISHHGQV